MSEKKYGTCPRCGAPCEVAELIDIHGFDGDTTDVPYDQYKYHPQPGAVWIRATKLKIEFGKNYYAQWLDGNIKTTGWFQESDGTFFWNVPGYIPIGKDEYEHLSILDESGTAAGREEELWEAFENELYEIYRREGLANAASKAHSQIYLLKVKFKQKEK